MISQHRSTFVSTLSALALLGWVALESSKLAYADAAQSEIFVDDAKQRLQKGDTEGAKALLRDLEDWPQPFMERECALELLVRLKSS